MKNLIEEVNKMRKMMGLNENLGLSIDEHMMSPKAVALGMVEMLPNNYNISDIEKALDEYIKTGSINIYVSEKFRRDDKWRNELFANIEELKTKGLDESFDDKEKELAWKEFQKNNHVTNHTIKVAKQDFEKQWNEKNKQSSLGESFDNHYIDDISAAKSSARGKQEFNQDAIDYVGGEDIWDNLSQSEQDSVLADIGSDWNRSRSMG
jgi:hypothetical protein